MLRNIVTKTKLQTLRTSCFLYITRDFNVMTYLSVAAVQWGAATSPSQHLCSNQSLHLGSDQTLLGYWPVVGSQCNLQRKQLAHLKNYVRYWNLADGWVPNHLVVCISNKYPIYFFLHYTWNIVCLVRISHCSPKVMNLLVGLHSFPFESPTLPLHHRGRNCFFTYNANIYQNHKYGGRP